MGSLIFRFGSVLIRPMTQALTDYLVKQGGKKVAKNVAASLIKKGQGFKTVGSKKALQNALPKNKSLTVIKPKSTALTKVAPKSITKIGAGKATTIAGLAGAIPFIDKGGSGEVKKSSADTKKGKVDAGLQEALKKKARDAKNKKMNDIEKSTRGQKSKSTTTATTTKTKGSGKVKATAANTKDFAKTMAMQKKLIDKGANIKADGIMGPKTRAAMQKFMKPKTEKKVEKKVEKKTPNYGGAQTIPKRTENKVEKKKSKSFLGRVKEDFDKAVKETKRNFSDKRYFVNGVDSRKEKIKSKSNIKKKK